MKCVWLCPVIAVSLGCAGPMQGLYPPEEGEPGKVVYVVSHGWHTGIVIRRADIAEGIWPEPHDFVDAEHVEVGWGDRDFYLAPEATSGLALKAAFWPTTSVLHIVGFAGPVEQFFRGHEMIKVRLSAPGLDRLAAFIREAFARDEAGRAIRLGPGQQGHPPCARLRGYPAHSSRGPVRDPDAWLAVPVAAKERELPLVPAGRRSRLSSVSREVR